MSKFSYLFGTALSFFRIGPNAGIKNNAGTIEIRDAIDSTFVGVKASIVQATGNAIELNANAAETGADHKYSIARPGTGMAAAVTLTLPPNVGTAGQVIQTDGLGNLSYATLSGTEAPIAGSMVNPSGVSVIDFSVPAGVRRLTLLSSDLAIPTNSIVRLGTTSGMVATGYRNADVYAGAFSGGSTRGTTGLIVPRCTDYGSSCMVLYRTGTNRWNATGQSPDSASGDIMVLTTGSIQLPGELTTFSYISPTTIASGSLQLLWEF